jgi:lipopolysaccharide export system permease protein
MDWALRFLATWRLPAGSQLNAYIRVRTAKSFCLIACALTGLFSLLAFVEELARVGEGQYHVSGALVFVLLGIPSRLLHVAPASILLGSLLSLSALARSSELTAMQSLGVSQSAIVRPVLELCIPIVVILFLVAQFIIPPAELLADRQRSAALSSAHTQPDTSSLWAASDRTYINVARFDPGNRPVGIDIYSFKVDGTLAEIIEAESGAAGRNGTWLLYNVSRKRVVQWRFETVHLAQMPWKSFISPKQMRILGLPLDSIPPIALADHVRKLKKMHVRAPRFEHELWAKLSIPFSMVAMILVTSRLVFGPARTHSITADLARGVGFSIVFSLGQQILDSIGILLDLPAPICSLALPVLVIYYTLPALYVPHSFPWFAWPSNWRRARMKNVL